ncbi:MAG: ribosome biogenesis GTPase YlqF [Candidatus Gastranaerophilales bacterium]|nr:ribosome biogenesis GTPase YlqF [Candidatus Gastranaerophilales bacterium]
MPTIHWYPGHIAKAERKLQEKVNLIDIILEVIDSRIPLSSKYEGIEKLTGDKPRLIIMSKADLADPEYNAKWQEYLSKKTGLSVILTNTSSSKDLSHIIKEAVDLGKPKIAQLISKGLLPRPVRTIVIGMPNVGKSSIINKLIQTSKVKVGAKAGVTRVAQWVRVNPKLELLDTPGIIPMKLDNQERAAKLAIVNSISENAYDTLEIAQEFVNLLADLYPELLEDHYNIDLKETSPTLENIAIARNWLILGGVPDINRCASRILSDFRNGRIGRITLESIPPN